MIALQVFELADDLGGLIPAREHSLKLTKRNGTSVIAFNQVSNVCRYLPFKKEQRNRRWGKWLLSVFFVRACLRVCVSDSGSECVSVGPRSTFPIIMIFF